MATNEAAQTLAFYLIEKYYFRTVATTLASKKFLVKADPMHIYLEARLALFNGTIFMI